LNASLICAKRISRICDPAGRGSVVTRNWAVIRGGASDCIVQTYLYVHNVAALFGIHRVISWRPAGHFRLSQDVLSAENDAGESAMDGPLPFGGTLCPACSSSVIHADLLTCRQAVAAIPFCSAPNGPGCRPDYPDASVACFSGAALTQHCGCAVSNQQLNLIAVGLGSLILKPTPRFLWSNITHSIVDLTELPTGTVRG
jgi:hypothetical protein